MKNKSLNNFKIYVAGHNGMVGRAVIRYLKKEGVKNLIFSNRKKLNLLNSRNLERFIKTKKPDIIINCAGNGGALAINNKEVLEKAKLLRSWGRSSSLFDEKSEAIENRFNIDLDGIEYDAKFVFEIPGYNLEGSEIGAAFGLAQLNKLQDNISIRQNNFKKQCAFFEKYGEFFSNPIENQSANTAWLAFPILIKENAKFSRRDIQIYLEKRDIQTRVVFTGNIMRQPMMKDSKYISSKNGYNNADSIMERAFLLPLHHGMTDSMFTRLHSTIDEFIESL